MIVIVAGVWLALLHSCTGFGPAKFLSHRQHTLRLQATLEETVVKPNLKVPSSAWKWPAAWPFPADFLEISAEYEAPASADPSLSDAFYSHARSFMETEESALVVGTSFDTSDGCTAFPGAEIYSISTDSPSMKLPFASDSFSTVVFRSGVEHFTKPTEVFTELWRVTKPGGKCFVCFTSKPQLPAPLAPVKMWQTMSDEQKIWITGSYFHYSTLGGWENIEGYDILGSTGNQSLVFANSTEAGQPTAYVVQSAKMVLPPLEELDGSTTQNLSANMQKRLLGMGNLVPDDRKFVSVRLAAQYNASTSDAQKAQLVDSIDRLNSIYSVLKDVKEIVVPSPVKAMLATMMLSQWEGSAEQLGALRMSLGLDTADDFWGPVGSSTMQMAPKPKIYFLGDLVPKFGAPRYAAALAGFPALLAEVVSISKRKVPEATESQIQAFSVDLLLADYFDSEKGTKERILRYVESLTAEQLESMLII